MSIKAVLNDGTPPKGEHLFEADGWAIYRITYNHDNSKHLYACHVECTAEAIEGDELEYVATSWLSEDDPYTGLVGQRCYGCRCEVPEGIQGLIHMEESHG